jgi:hypothetical protein
MASKLASFEFPEVKREGRTSPYAQFYSDWFNGEIWKLKRDVKNEGKKLSEVALPKNTDYRAKSESMVTLLRNALKEIRKEGKSEFNSLRVAISQDEIVIQAYLDEAKAKKEAQAANASAN